MKNINTFFQGQTSLLDWFERVQSQYRRPSTALSYNALKTHLITYYYYSFSERPQWVAPFFITRIILAVLSISCYLCNFVIIPQR